VRWSALLLFAIGCKYPDPGSNMPADDQPPDDADMDDGNDDMEMPRCPAFTNMDNKTQLPGIQVAGFSAVEDESFAIAFLSQNTIGYTLPPFGEAYEMTDLVNNVTGAHVLGDGSALYLYDFNASPRIRRAINQGSPATWEAATDSGLPDTAFVGRPTDDDQQVVFANDTRTGLEEWTREAGVWTAKMAYTPADLGLDGTTEILSANLSPDGAYLLVSAGGGAETYGIYWRVRASNGTFSIADGSFGGLLFAGTYDQPHLTARCSHLFAANTATGYVDRFDVHP